MAEPFDITQLDLQNLSPEEAAKLARAQQVALAGRQRHALLGMLGTVPELQKAGAAEYAQAGREREGGQQTAANVLRYTLEKTSQERQLAALQAQIAYQNAQLGLMNRQFQEGVRKTQSEEDRQDYEAYKRGLATPPASMVEREGKTGGELANIEAVTQAVGNLPLVPKAAAEAIGGVLKAGKSAELKSLEQEKTKAGYRQEAPLSFEEFVKAKRSGFTHPAMKPESVSPAAPQAPGETLSPASQGPAPVGEARSHYRYVKGKNRYTSPMRVPSDGNRDLGPAEPNPEFRR